MNDSACKKKTVHLTLCERHRIADLRKDGRTPSEIARRIGRPQPTVWKEIKRNSTGDGYDSEVAHAKTLARRFVPTVVAHLVKHPELATHLLHELRHFNSIEQALANIRTKHPHLPTIHVQTVYRWVRRSGHPMAKAVRKLMLHPRSRRVKSEDGRGKIPNMVPIEHRPEGVGERKIVGWWESDVVESPQGVPGCLLVLTEMVTRVTFLALCSDKKAATVTGALATLFSHIPAHLKLGLTCDRGKEMSWHEQFTHTTQIPVYFTNPHSPWEKGQVENTNGNVRRNFPKGTHFAKVTQVELELCQNRLNSRNMRVLSMATPQELYSKAAGVIPYAS